MVKLLLIGFGGALGTMARYGVNGWVSGAQARLPSATALFPLGTMVVNVTGCFVIGWLSAVCGPALERVWMRPEWRDFLMIGFCGGYTTFSSFGLQTLALGRDGEWLWAGVNVIGSNAAGLFAVYLGMVCGRAMYLNMNGGTG